MHVLSILTDVAQQVQQAAAGTSWAQFITDGAVASVVAIGFGMFAKGKLHSEVEVKGYKDEIKRLNSVLENKDKQIELMQDNLREDVVPALVRVTDLVISEQQMKADLLAELRRRTA